MDEKVFDEPIRKRGIQLEGFAIESVTLDDESSKKIDQYELGSNAYMQQGTMVGAYADAVRDAANNSNGAANGFMGIGMMNMMSGGLGSNVMQNAFNPQNTAQPQPEAPAQPSQPAQEEAPKAEVNGWVCPTCGNTATGKFCGECGTKKPEGNVCPNCGEKIVISRQSGYGSSMIDDCHIIEDYHIAQGNPDDSQMLDEIKNIINAK
jgi:membrane protease subunit (stomatin/prohibitin family)